MRGADAMHRIEVGALVALAFFLPLYEAPKSIAWLAYVVAWLANRARTRDFGGAWDIWDSLIVAWLASGFLSAAFAGVHGTEWRATVDLVRYVSLLWVVKRSRYAPGETRAVLGALVASAIVGLVIAYWRVGTGSREWLELNSVGHVNHTAVYLAILFVACACWMFATWRAVAVAVVVLLLVSLFWTASRAAIGVGLASVVLLALAWWPRSRRPLVVSLVAVAISASTAWVIKADVVAKQEANELKQNVLSFRDGIWRGALVAWQRYPVFGLGMDNFGKANLKQIERWRTEAGRPFDPRLYSWAPHAHNLFLNTLAERGAVGAAVLAAVLLTWLAFLWRYRPRRSDSDEEWTLWGGAAAAWLVTVGVGLANTTLHHEHALLAVLLLGLWLSRLKTRPAVA